MSKETNKTASAYLKRYLPRKNINELYHEVTNPQKPDNPLRRPLSGLRIFDHVNEGLVAASDIDFDYGRPYDYSFSLRTPDEQEFQKLKSRLEQNCGNLENKLALAPNNIFFLDDFILKRNDNNTSLSIRELVPENTTVITNTMLPSQAFADCFNENSEERTIYAPFGYKVSMLSIAVLLHECGHIADELEYLKNDPSKVGEIKSVVKTFGSRPLSVKEKALMLRTERNAWAYAVKKLRPFFEPEIPNRNDYTTGNLLKFGRW